MNTLTLLPVLAAALLVLSMLYVLLRNATSLKNGWLFPAALSLLFFLFSVKASLTEGPTGFWVEHTRNLWGNQIWFDLLIAAGIGWFLIVPQAKALRMRLPFWLILIVCTGGIGFLAMLARMLYLREQIEKA